VKGAKVHTTSSDAQGSSRSVHLMRSVCEARRSKAFACTFVRCLCRLGPKHPRQHPTRSCLLLLHALGVCLVKTQMRMRTCNKPRPHRESLMLVHSIWSDRTQNCLSATSVQGTENSCIYTYLQTYFEDGATYRVEAVQSHTTDLACCFIVHDRTPTSFAS
jgi:hypothetical protein